MKTFNFSLVLRTRENTNVFITLDDNIYGIVTASGYYALFPCINRSIVRSQCIFVLLVNVILRSEMDHGWIVCKPTSPPISK